MFKVLWEWCIDLLIEIVGGQFFQFIVQYIDCIYVVGYVGCEFYDFYYFVFFVQDWVVGCLQIDWFVIFGVVYEFVGVEFVVVYVVLEILIGLVCGIFFVDEYVVMFVDDFVE